MSVRVQSAVWEHSEHGGNKLLLLVAISDNARDDGVAWPGTRYLARKTRLSLSAVKRGVKLLAESGELSILSQGGGAERSRYRVEVETLRAKPSRPLEGVQSDRGQDEPGSASDTPPGSPRVCVKEPSVNHQETPSESGDPEPQLPGLETERSSGDQDSDKKTVPPAEDETVLKRVWEHYVALFTPPQKNLTPSRMRLLAKALKETHDPENPEAGIDLVMRSISGLKRWRETKPGDTSLSAIFATRPGGRALGDQIDFFASQVEGQAIVDSRVPSVSRDRITRRQIEVVEMVRSPDRGGAIREAGEEALEWLRSEAKLEPVIDGQSVTSWREVTA